MKGERTERLMYVAPFICVGLLWLSAPIAAFLVVFVGPIFFLASITSRTPRPAANRLLHEDDY